MFLLADRARVRFARVVWGCPEGEQMSARLDPHPLAVPAPPAAAAEKPCGCREGAAAVFAALALLALQALGALDLPLVGTGAWSWLGFLFAAALLGKAVGLSLGWARLRRAGALPTEARRG
jgi:hypothetical protein